MTATAEEALAAYRRCSGLDDPAPDYLEPEIRTATLRDIQAWYDGREGEGPWCHKCGKTAVFQRRGLSRSSLWCFDCGRAVPGVFYPIDTGEP